MQRGARIARVGAVVLVLACSSGGSGGQGGAEQTIVTVADAPVIVSELVQGLALAGQLGDVGAAPDASASLAVDADAVGASSIGASVSIPPTTLDCDPTGTLTVSADIANPPTPGLGDQISTSYEACVQDASGPTLDGDLDVIVDAFGGDFDTGRFVWSLDTTFDATPDQPFTLTQDDLVSVFGGHVTMIQDTRQPGAIGLTLNGGTMQMTTHVTPTPAVEQVRRFFNLKLQTLRNVSSGAYELPAVYQDPLSPGAGPVLVAARGSFEAPKPDPMSDTGFDGRVTFNIAQSLTGQLPAPPEAGVLLITGANGATIRAEAEGGDVTLEIDTDGDSATAPVICTKSWIQIFAGTTCP